MGIAGAPATGCRIVIDVNALLTESKKYGKSLTGEPKIDNHRE